MSNGVLTVGEDDKIATCNAAGRRILKARIRKWWARRAAEIFTGANAWVLDKLASVKKAARSRPPVDAKMGGLLEPAELSVNVTVMPLRSGEKKLGSLLVIEDISGEKRVHRPCPGMTPRLADQLLPGGEDSRRKDRRGDVLSRMYGGLRRLGGGTGSQAMVDCSTSTSP